MKKNLRETLTVALPPSPRIVNGILEDVKILGLKSKNGRRYLSEAVTKAIGKYEGVSVYLNHCLSGDPRKIEDKFAKIVSPRRDAKDGGIRGGLKVNWKHPFAEAFKGWLETDPTAIGLSHVVNAEVSHDKDGNELVTEIYEVESVDLVGDPATTKGIFEQTMPDPMSPEAFAMAPSDEGFAAKIGELVQAIMIDATLDTSMKKQKILGALKLLDEPEEEMPKDAPMEEEESDDEKPHDEGDEEEKPNPDGLEEEKSSDDAKERPKDEDKEEKKAKESLDRMLKTLKEEILGDMRKLLKLSEDKQPKSLPPARAANVTFDTFIKTLSETK